MMRECADEAERLRRRLERERRARLEAEVIAERATARLFEADRIKSMFVTNVSHELRSPLTAVQGFADVLIDRWDRLDDKRKREFLHRIAQNTKVLRELIEQLLDFTDMERDSVQVTPAEDDVAAHTVDLIEQIRPTVTHHHLEVHAERPVRAYSDSLALRRIITNLVDNAAKYSPPGTTISVSVRAATSGAVIEVTDEGPGIAAIDRERVFDRFYRGSTDSTLRTRGLGIGLAVVRSLTDALGGTVRIDDPDGGGTRFVVSLPGLPPDPARR